jgi:hypothetical protein
VPRSPRVGSTLPDSGAPIAAVQDEAARAEDTDWPQILTLYNILRRISDNPMVRLNHAVATGMVDRLTPASVCSPRPGRSIFRNVTTCSDRAGDENFPLSDEPAGKEFPAPPDEDPHSAEDVSGYQVWADEGEMGRLEAFIVDETSWHIDYLDVKAGDWLRRRSVLVPTRWVKSISWGKHRVNLEQARTHI